MVDVAPMQLWANSYHPQELHEDFLFSLDDLDNELTMEQLDTLLEDKDEFELLALVDYWAEINSLDWQLGGLQSSIPIVPKIANVPFP